MLEIDGRGVKPSGRRQRESTVRGRHVEGTRPVLASTHVHEISWNSVTVFVVEHTREVACHRPPRRRLSVGEIVRRRAALSFAGPRAIHRACLRETSAQLVHPLWGSFRARGGAPKTPPIWGPRDRIPGRFDPPMWPSLLSPSDGTLVAPSRRKSRERGSHASDLGRPGRPPSGGVCRNIALAQHGAARGGGGPLRTFGGRLDGARQLPQRPGGRTEDSRLPSPSSGCSSVWRAPSSAARARQREPT